MLGKLQEWPEVLPSTGTDRRNLSIVILAWAYTLAIPLVLELRTKNPALAEFAALWGAVPLQALALLAVGCVLHDRRLLGLRQRRVWWWIFAYTAFNPITTYFWNTDRPTVVREVLAWPEVIDLFDYWLLIAGLGVLFKSAGGTFKRWGVWLDVATMVAVQLVALWSIFWAHSSPQDIDHDISLAATMSYALTLAVMMSMSALVCLRLPNHRGRYSVLLLVGAAVAAVGSEVIWLSSWLVNYEFIGPYYNFGDVLCFACISSAAWAVHYQPSPQTETLSPERRAYSFLPALAVLVAIALVAGTLITNKSLDAWILVGLVTLCAALLITRQLNERNELRELHRRLAARDADARLTELVRRSDDLILVVDGRGLVSFASPAADALVGMPASQVQGLRAAALFGSSHDPSLCAFLDRTIGGGEAPEVLELDFLSPRNGARAVTITASNQLANPLITGVVLTVHDVSGQRALEREVLDVATRERVRLCADMHDGLGQELTGIALLLHGAAKAPHPDPELHRQQLEAIVAQLNRTIGATRDLAHGFSPLHVVRGSLGGALRRMALESGDPVPIHLHIDPEFDDRVIGDFAADHLYRIVQEAVANALRHSGGTQIDIAMSAARGRLLLSIADDGKGIGELAPEQDGLGLRLMEYRARIVGATLRTAGPTDLGTRIELMMPLPGV
jgi:PAS domain S-box-containing protein